MKEAGYIDTHTHAYPHPTNKVSMYFLKKLHKTPHGIRPIVSGCSGPTERVSSFLDHIVKPLVPTIPSYIKDSPHLISLLENTPIPNNAIVATIGCVQPVHKHPTGRGHGSLSRCRRSCRSPPISLEMSYALQYRAA